MNPFNPNRLLIAFLLYGALAASAFYTLTGNIRIVVLIFFAGLAVKTWLAQEREKLYSTDELEIDRSREDLRGYRSKPVVVPVGLSETPDDLVSKRHATPI